MKCSSMADLGVLDSEVIVVRAPLLRGVMQKAAGRPPRSGRYRACSRLVSVET